MHAYQKIIVFIITISLLAGGGFVFYTNFLQQSLQGITALIEPKDSENPHETPQKEENNSSTSETTLDTPDTQATASTIKKTPFTIKRSIHDHIDSVNDLIFAFDLNSLDQTPYYKADENTYIKLSPSFLLKMDYKELLQVNNLLEKFGVFIQKDSQYVKIETKNT
jgi:hypothetical protein